MTNVRRLMLGPLILTAMGAAMPLLLTACGREPVQESLLPEKDLTNFRIPAEVQAIAPLMQEHLYRLLPFQSSRFQVKPDFVFIEGPISGEDDLVTGRLNPLVMRMNLIHLVYYRDDSRIWSASLLKGLRTNAGVTAKSGYVIKFANEDETVRLSFQDGGTVIEGSFPRDHDHVAWLEDGRGKLYLYHYVLPNRPAKTSERGQQTQPTPKPDEPGR